MCRRFLTCLKMYSSHQLTFNRPFCGTQANNAEPDQTPQNAASDQGLHCLLAESYIKI